MNDLNSQSSDESSTSKDFAEESLELRESDSARTAARKAVGTVKPPLLQNDMHDHPHGVVKSGGGTGRISRTLVNFWLDLTLGFVFVVLCVVAVIVQFVFPPGVAARDWTLWGMTFGQWSSLQFGTITVLMLGVLVHVMLHWTWVCSVLTRRILGQQQLPDNGIRTIYGVGLLIVLLITGAVVIGLAQWSIVAPQ